MPRKTRKHLALKKNKNAKVSPKMLNQIYKKQKKLLECKTKHCKKLLRKEQYKENLYKAWGWNKKMTKNISRHQR